MMILWRKLTLDGMVGIGIFRVDEDEGKCVMYCERRDVEVVLGSG